VRQGRHLPQAAYAGWGEVRHELPGIRAIPDQLDRRILLPDDQAGPLPGPPRGAHSRAYLEGGQEAAHDRVLHQGFPEQRAGRAVQADPGPRPQGPRDALPGFRPAQRVEDRRARREVGHHLGIQPRSLSKPSAKIVKSRVFLLERRLLEGVAPVRPGGLIIAHNMRRPAPNPRYIEAITTSLDLDTSIVLMSGAGSGSRSRNAETGG
jgi:hypothetical protein